MVISHFWTSIAKDDEKYPLVSKSSVRKVLLALESNGKTINGLREEKSMTTLG
jgi:hypothetical protein